MQLKCLMWAFLFFDVSYFFIALTDIYVGLDLLDEQKKNIVFNKRSFSYAYTYYIYRWLLVGNSNGYPNHVSLSYIIYFYSKYIKCISNSDSPSSTNSAIYT